MTVAWDKELLKIINEQTRGVRFQSVMTVTDEGSHCSNHTRSCPKSTGLYQVKMGHAPAYQLTSINQESTRSATRIRNMTDVYQQELQQCLQFVALRSKMTVVWADGGESERIYKIRPPNSKYDGR